MTSQKTLKLITYTIHLVLLFLLFIPIAEVFASTSEEDMEWQNIYIYSDEISIIMFAPFYVVWVILQFSKK